MTKVFGTVETLHVPPHGRAVPYLRFISGLEAFTGPVVEVQVGDGEWCKVTQFPEQIPGWPLDDNDEFPPKLKVRGVRANIVTSTSISGFRLLLRLKDLAFEQALVETPAFLDEVLSYAEDAISPLCVGTGIGVRTSRAGYPMPLPISNDSQFRAGMTYWKVDRRCPDVLQKQSITNERFQRAATMPLPPNVERSFSDPYLTFRWKWDGHVTAETYGIQRGLQHQWYRDALGLNIDSNYNELGDYMTGVGPKSADPMFTYYHRDLGTRSGAYGTKGMVPEGGVLDPDVLKSFSEMLAAGRTPSGLQLNLVRIIVPSREMAVATYEQARAAGIKAVLYPGKYGMMNPFPEWPGGWLHEVAPGRGYRGVKR